MPVAVKDYGPPLIPRRSRRANPAADLGGIPSGGGAPGVNVDEVPPIPPPPVVDAAQEAQMVERRNLREVAESLEHLLIHKPANQYCDACNRGKMRDAKKFQGVFYSKSTSYHLFGGCHLRPHCVKNYGGIDW
eukprot:15295195-Heterocapsa_arctica.AAC.1